MTIRVGWFRDNVLTSRRALPRHGEDVQGFRLILNADVRVTHRHSHVAVSSQFLCLGNARSVSKQLSNVRVPACCVKVSEAFAGAIRDSHSL